MTFDEYMETVNATCNRDIYGHADYRTSDMRSAFMAGADAVKSLPHRAMFDSGWNAGRKEAAREILLLLPGCPDAQMLSDEIKVRFGLEI